MKRLLKKDLRLIQPGVIIVFLMVLFFSGLASIGEDAQLKYGMLMFLIVYILNSNVEARNNKVDSNVILYSLPINKRQVVLSKYINIGLYFILAILLVFLSSNILKFVGVDNVESLSPNGVALCILMTLIYASIYIPATYAFGYKSVSYVNGVLYLLFYIWIFTLFRNAEIYRNIVAWYLDYSILIIIILSVVFIASIDCSMKLSEIKYV